MNEQGGITTVNRIVLQWFGLQPLTHLNQLGRVNETYPDMFAVLRAGDASQLTIANERVELQISLRVCEISFKQGVMRLVSLSNIGSELESKEMESWTRLIRVMTHEIMNSIAPITSLSDTLLTSTDFHTVFHYQRRRQRYRIEHFALHHEAARR